ncbi:MAG TPA: hypothetical protein VGB26_05600 [Nitrospiria bacterium]
MKKWERFRISLFLLPMIVFYHGFGEGSDWKIFDQGETFFYYYYEDTIRKTANGIVSLWIRTVPHQKVEFEKVLEERQKAGIPLHSEIQDYGYSLIFMKLHCIEKKAKIIQEKIYNKKGFLLKSYLDTTGWKPVSHLAFEGALSGQVCPANIVQK